MVDLPASMFETMILIIACHAPNIVSSTLSPFAFTTVRENLKSSRIERGSTLEWSTTSATEASISRAITFVFKVCPSSGCFIMFYISMSKASRSTHSRRMVKDPLHYKTVLCRNDPCGRGVCPFGSKCQHAHGSRELHLRATFPHRTTSPSVVSSARSMRACLRRRLF